MSCITHGCVAIALELPQSMDHSLQPPVLSATACRLLQNPARITLRPARPPRRWAVCERGRQATRFANVSGRAPGACGELKVAGTSEMRKSGKLHSEFLEFFSRKSASGLLDAWGLPVLPCFPTPLVSVQLRPCFHRSLENVRNPASAPAAHDTRTESCFRHKLLRRAMLTSAPDEIEKLQSTV
jgi:hypothetical protein